MKTRQGTFARAEHISRWAVPPYLAMKISIEPNGWELWIELMVTKPNRYTDGVFELIDASDLPLDELRKEFDHAVESLRRELECVILAEQKAQFPFNVAAMGRDS